MPGVNAVCDNSAFNVCGEVYMYLLFISKSLVATTSLQDLHAAHCIAVHYCHHLQNHLPYVFPRLEAAATIFLMRTNCGDY